MKFQITRRLVTISFIIGCFVIAGLSQTPASTQQNSLTKTLRARFNERFVYHALQQIQGAQATYQATGGGGNFAANFRELAEAGFLDRKLAADEVYGYHFLMTATLPTADDPASYNVTATPRGYPKNGRLSYYLDETGEIRGTDKNGEPAAVSDPVIVLCGNYETEAIQTLRTLHSAELTYQSTGGFGNFGTLQNLYSNGLINYSTASGSRCGYGFSVTTTNSSSNISTSFQVTAVPKQYQITGTRSFFINESGIIRGADRNGQPADADDLPVEDSSY